MSRCLKFLLLPVMLAACVPVYTLVRPGPVTVGALSVQAAGTWNLAPSAAASGLRKDSALWTRDGAMLDQLLLIPGVPAGQPLLIDRSKQAALPVFRPDMLPNELEELTESTLVKYFGEGGAAVSTSSLRPYRFGDNQGVMFDLQAAVSDSPDYRGVAGAFIANSALYVVIYMAAEPYYFDKHRSDAVAVISSARLGPAS